jgi:hypothetical protein
MWGKVEEFTDFEGSLTWKRLRSDGKMALTARFAVELDTKLRERRGDLKNF